MFLGFHTDHCVWQANQIRSAKRRTHIPSCRFLGHSKHKRR